MSNWHIWSPSWPSQLAGLESGLVESFGPADGIGSLRDLDSVIAGDESSAIVLVMSGSSADVQVGDWLARLDGSGDVNIVVIVGDGYLGTDSTDRSGATAAAAAVSAVRSLAVTRGSRTRANVICAPEVMFGGTGEHRGPLAQEVHLDDIVEATAFFIHEASAYLNGQVLFVDSGRQLFSSHTA